MKYIIMKISPPASRVQQVFIALLLFNSGTATVTNGQLRKLEFSKFIFPDLVSCLITEIPLKFTEIKPIHITFMLSATYEDPCISVL